jgi:formylglycine-generating enzyme required for sulfatase activity
MEPYTESIAGTTVTFDMVPVPGGTMSLHDALAPGGRSTRVDVSPFWVGKTEVTWDEYDVWMLRLDVEPAQRAGIDAESRPSRPYGAPDRGFGHAGFAAISVTYQAATRYTEWLSDKTGRRYRLPTWAEWQIARLKDIDAGGGVDPALDDRSWHAENAGGTTHAVSSLQPGTLGLFDILGNAGEWAVNQFGDPALYGGHYRTAPDELFCGTSATQDDSWNERDPQIPKSSGWLSDGPFAGFRVVREPDR